MEYHWDMEDFFVFSETSKKFLVLYAFTGRPCRGEERVSPLLFAPFGLPAVLLEFTAAGSSMK